MFIKKTIVIALLCAAGCAAAADTAGMNKQQLVDRVLQLWHVETLGEAMLREPVADAMQQARVVLQNKVPPERREATLQDLGAEAKKFLDDATPVVRSSSQKLAASTVGPLLAANFNEEELRQIIAILESPVKGKFETLVPQMNKALGEKVASETRPVIDPKLQDFRQRIGMRLRTAIAQ